MVVKNVSKPNGEFNVCMGGDDGRYGWLGYQGTERSRRHRHLFARSEFHQAITLRIGTIFSRIIWRWDTTARGPVYEILLGVGREKGATHPDC
jgi:hypothetical protein